MLRKGWNAFLAGQGGIDGAQGGWRVDSCLMQWVPPPSRELFGSLEFGTGACTETKEAGETGGRKPVLKTYMQ